MDLHNFVDDEAAVLEANKIIDRILSDKTYSNPEKLSLLISEYQKKQVRLDAQLSKAVKSQIQSINLSKESVSEANKWMQQANEKTDNIKNIWQQNSSFHGIMEDIISLHTFQNNLSKVIQHLTYFIDMDSEMNKLQKLAEDQNKYLMVNAKLMNLIALRDAIMQDASWQRQSAVMKKHFVKVDNFEITFYDKIFEKFSDCLYWAKENPNLLSICVKVIESCDKAAQLKEKPQTKVHRAIEAIRQSIDMKFDEKLHSQDDLIGIIQNAKFATTDLVEVGDYVLPCFSKKFPIMEIYQEQYQKNIEKHIIPYFDQIQEEQQYGNLVALLAWIDDYQTMLSRAGLDPTHLVDLKSKIKVLMPMFLEHNRKLVHQYVGNCIQEDQSNYNRQYYTEVIREQGDLISNFPSDIFRFINQQAQMIKDQLKGQIFVQFVRCITEVLNYYQQHLTEQIMNEFQAIKMVQNQQKIVDYQYKVILFINNFNQCLKHAGQSRQLFCENLTEDYKARIEKIFKNQVQNKFNQTIPKFIHVIVELIFMNVVKNNFPMFFTPQWLADKSGQKMTKALKIISIQLDDIDSQKLMTNLIHYRNLVRETLDYFLMAYFQQMILYIRIIYKMTGSGWQPKYTNQYLTEKQISQQTGSDFKSVFYSKVGFSEALKRDKHIFIKFVEGLREGPSKTLIGKYTNKFVFIGDLFNKKKTEFETLLNKIVQLFPDQASFLIDSVMLARDQAESRNQNSNNKPFF